MSNNLSTNKALDLYAKVEDIVGVKEASPQLYAYYLLYLQSIGFDSMLDVGCGSGDFLIQMRDALSIPEVLGIDLSSVMVQRARAKGLSAKNTELANVKGSFDVITAVFDMLNYLNKEELESFLSSIEKHLNPKGFFLCDINTLYGFREVAVGSYIADDDHRFLTIDSEFEDGVYKSDFTLFEKSKMGCYRKSQETIEQLYHSIDEITMLLPNMRLASKDSVTLYGDESDKSFLVFQMR